MKLRADIKRNENVSNKRLKSKLQNEKRIELLRPVLHKPSEILS